MNEGKRLEEQQIEEIKKLSYRKAREKYKIGTATVKLIKLGKLRFFPKRQGKSITGETIQKVFDSVIASPHWNTKERADRLGLRVETVQKILASEGLSRLIGRLKFAGYRVETMRSLASARLRRIVASAPGRLVHIDYKTFGMVRRIGNEEGRRIGGFIVIDSLTAYATVFLHPAEDSEGAVRALEKFIKSAPFKVNGIVLSDNGKAFLSDKFIEFVKSAGLMLRTTHPYHPWSNGKAEALNKTLKYQCFPVICANDIRTWEGLTNLVDGWLIFYNTRRVHTGSINRGLPPLVFLEHWNKAPGTPLQKLIHLGVIKPHDMKHLRVLGASKKSKKLIEKALGKNTTGSTYIAFVIDKNPGFAPRGPRSVISGHTIKPPAKSVILAK